MKLPDMCSHPYSRFNYRICFKLNLTTWHEISAPLFGRQPRNLLQNPCCAQLGSGTKIPNVEFIETREMPQKEISSSVPPWNKLSFKQLSSNITQACGDCKKPESNNKRKKTMMNLRSTRVFHHITLIRESNHAVVQWPWHMKQI